MAYDPEARKQSNSALIIGLIALVVLGGAALAYFATRPGPETGPTTVINPVREKETVIIDNTAPAPVVVDPNPSTIIVTPPVENKPDTVVVTPPATTTTETTTTVRNAEPAPRAPVANPPAEKPESKTTVNNTIINPPAPSGNADKAKPVKPDAATSDAATSNAAPAAEDNAVVGY